MFEAGHEVGKYQTETVYRVFMRSLFGKDIATGMVDVGAGFQSQGPKSAWSKSELPEDEPKKCIAAGQFQKTSVWEGVENGTVDGY